MIDALRFTSSSTIIAASAPPPRSMASRPRTLRDIPPGLSDDAPAASPAETALSCQDPLAVHHDLVVDAVRFVAARHHLPRDMADELRGRVMLHLATNNQAVLRAWRRECSLHTYLVTVITRVFLDYRNQEWGKAKPPALARRLGDVALNLWRLTHRRRLSFDEAVETLHAEHGVTDTREALRAIYNRLPAPTRRYFVDVSELAHAEQPGADADRLVRDAECQTLAARVERALAHALSGLAAEDRLVLKLFFTNGMTRAQISRVLQLDQQRLYPRFLQLLSRLRAALLAQGVAADDVRQVVGWAHLPPGADVIAEACKIDDAGPSHRMERPPIPGRRSRPRDS